jgi:hypothetical protein
MRKGWTFPHFIATAAYKSSQPVRFGPPGLSQAGISYRGWFLLRPECEGVALNTSQGIASIRSTHDQQ